MILKIVNLCKSPNRKFISKKYSPTYKTHKVYFLGRKINKSPISGIVLLMYFELHREKRSLSRLDILRANMNLKCFLWKRIKYFTFLYCRINNLRDIEEVKGVRDSVERQSDGSESILGTEKVKWESIQSQLLSIIDRHYLWLTNGLWLFKTNKQAKILLMVKTAKKVWHPKSLKSKIRQ